ncbi:hypothetical protein [Nocardioides sp.]|jgi:hypothetical protein|uniref:hypothetical protein n=1 Tax=Nocardioides sp. TaxID=35761 RepID=UPI0031FEF13F|nr:hypothetical protein [Nocardioides sp.]
MNDTLTPIETQARHQIAERVARAATPKIASVPPRHRLAQRLRRVADRIDN